MICTLLSTIIALIITIVIVIAVSVKEFGLFIREIIDPNDQQNKRKRND